jgi:hypothetical protein
MSISYNLGRSVLGVSVVAGFALAGASCAVDMSNTDGEIATESAAEVTGNNVCSLQCGNKEHPSPICPDRCLPDTVACFRDANDGCGAGCATGTTCEGEQHFSFALGPFGTFKIDLPGICAPAVPLGGRCGVPRHIGKTVPCEEGAQCSLSTLSCERVTPLPGAACSGVKPCGRGQICFNGACRASCDSVGERLNNCLCGQFCGFADGYGPTVCLQCQKLGESCGGDAQCCPHGNNLPYRTRACDQASHRCVETDGSSCLNDTQCRASSYCKGCIVPGPGCTSSFPGRCAARSCVQAGLVAEFAADCCDPQEDAVTNPLSVNQDWRCRLPVGATCSDSSQCGSGATCYNNTCLTPVGGKCTSHGQCMPSGAYQGNCRGGFCGGIPTGQKCDSFVGDCATGNCDSKSGTCCSLTTCILDGDCCYPTHCQQSTNLCI